MAAKKKKKGILEGAAKNFGRMILFGFIFSYALSLSAVGGIAELLGMALGAILFWSFVEHLHYQSSKTKKEFKEVIKAWAISAAFIVVPLLLLSLISALVYAPSPTTYSLETRTVTHENISFAIPTEMKSDAHVAEWWGAEEAYTIGSDIVAFYYYYGILPEEAVSVWGEDYNALPDTRYWWESEGGVIVTHFRAQVKGVDIDGDSVVISCGDTTYEVFYGSWFEKNQEISESVLNSVKCLEPNEDG